MPSWLTRETLPLICIAVGALIALILTISLWSTWKGKASPKKIQDFVYPLRSKNVSYEYCSHCGKSISEGKKYCPYCGGHVSRSSRYCQWCGACLYKRTER